MLNQVGLVVAGTAALALAVPWTPPSLPAIRMLDEPGTKARACWSTWTGLGLTPL